MSHPNRLQNIIFPYKILSLFLLWKQIYFHHNHLFFSFMHHIINNYFAPLHRNCPTSLPIVQHRTRYPGSSHGCDRIWKTWRTHRHCFKSFSQGNAVLCRIFSFQTCNNYVVRVWCIRVDYSVVQDDYSFFLFLKL